MTIDDAIRILMLSRFQSRVKRYKRRYQRGITALEFQRLMLRDPNIAELSEAMIVIERHSVGHLRRN